MVAFNCSSCGRTWGIENEAAGRIVECPECGADITVPELEPVADVQKALPEKGSITKVDAGERIALAVTCILLSLVVAGIGAVLFWPLMFAPIGGVIGAVMCLSGHGHLQVVCPVCEATDIIRSNRTSFTCNDCRRRLLVRGGEIREA